MLDLYSPLRSLFSATDFMKTVLGYQGHIGLSDTVRSYGEIEEIWKCVVLKNDWSITKKNK